MKCVRHEGQGLDGHANASFHEEEHDVNPQHDLYARRFRERHVEEGARPAAPGYGWFRWSRVIAWILVEEDGVVARSGLYVLRGEARSCHARTRKAVEVPSPGSNGMSRVGVSVKSNSLRGRRRVWTKGRVGRVRDRAAAVCRERLQWVGLVHARIFAWAAKDINILSPRASRDDDGTKLNKLKNLGGGRSDERKKKINERAYWIMASLWLSLSKRRITSEFVKLSLLQKATRTRHSIFEVPRSAPSIMMSGGADFADAGPNWLAAFRTCSCQSRHDQLGPRGKCHQDVSAYAPFRLFARPSSL